MHVFKFSPRKGTPAAGYENQADGTVKEARSEKVLALSDRCALEFNSRFTGRDMPVLYEGELKGNPGCYEGFTPNYIRVVSKGDAGLVGNIATTRLARAEGDHIMGETPHVI